MTNTFAARQATLQKQVPSVLEICQKHGLETTRIEALRPLVEHFELRVPLIGAFSSGKSSLLNALLGESLLVTDVTPETAVPTELRYGPERRFVGRLPDDRTLALQEDDLREGRLGALAPNGWVEATLPSPALSGRAQLVLVDMPGWDSSIEAHERVIDGYASRSLAYGVVVSCEEGTLRDTLRRALLELAVQQMPILLIVTKTDKRPAEDVEAVVQRLQTDIAELIGSPPLAVAVTSARKRNIGEFAAALDTLQAKAGEIFENQVVGNWRRILEEVAQHLELMANRDNKDAASLQADIEKLQHDLREFDARLERETEALEAQVGPILGAIRLRVDNALMGQLDALARRAMNGANISDDILGTARLVVSEAIRQEFEPAMQRYLDRLVDALPSRVDLRLDLSEAATGDSGGEFRWKELATTLAPLLSKIPHPIGEILAPVVMLLAALLDRHDDEQRRAIEAAQRQEAAKDQVESAIREAVRQIETQLRPVLTEQIHKAKAEVARNIAAERSELEKTLATLIQALQQGEAQAAALRERALADLARIKACMDEIEAKA